MIGRDQKLQFRLPRCIQDLKRLRHAVLLLPQALSDPISCLPGDEIVIRVDHQKCMSCLS
jgi:hypothetical protein